MIPIRYGTTFTRLILRRLRHQTTYRRWHEQGHEGECEDLKEAIHPIEPFDTSVGILVKSFISLGDLGVLQKVLAWDTISETSVITTAFPHCLHEARPIIGGHHRADFLMMTSHFFCRRPRSHGERAAVAMKIKFDLDGFSCLLLTEMIGSFPAINGLCNLPCLLTHTNKVKQHCQANKR